MTGLAKSSEEQAFLKSTSFQIEVSNVSMQYTIVLMLGELTDKPRAFLSTHIHRVSAMLLQNS